MTSGIGASQAQVALYAPYCNGVTRGPRLEQALELLDRGLVNGRRQLRHDGGHDFQLSWSAGASPLENCSCQLQFSAFPDLSYDFTLPTYLLVSWLMDLLEAGLNLPGPSDLPDSFWRWLLVGALPPGASA